jgi:hypothetical protein
MADEIIRPDGSILKPIKMGEFMGLMNILLKIMGKTFAFMFYSTENRNCLCYGR